MERFGNTPRELALLELANRQHGVLHDGQLTRRGLTRAAIDQRVGAGRLSRLHEGVFAWGHSALTREGRWLAALWACGEGAILSHTTAAAFHGMAKEVGTDVHVSTTSPSSRGPASSFTASAVWTPQTSSAGDCSGSRESPAPSWTLPTARRGRTSAAPWTRFAGSRPPSCGVRSAGPRDASGAAS